MKPKVIHTEAEYKAALQRIEALMEKDPDPASPDGQELELFSLLVERYENEEFPMDLPSPVEAIRFRMEQQGLKNKDLVPFIGSASKVSEVLSCQRSLSLGMIRNLVKGLGIPAEVLIGKSGAELQPEKAVAELRNYPIAQMLKRGWFPGFDGTLAEAKKQVEDLFIAFAGELGPNILKPAFNRQHLRDGGQKDDYALAAWRIRVMNLAMKERLPPYCKGVLNHEFLSRLAQLSFLDAGPKLARESLNKYGIHLIIEPHLPKTHLDGAAMKLPDGSPVVALTLRHDRLDNFWFTLFHELAHVHLHLDKEGYEVFFDNLDNEGMDRCEKEADALAQEALIPTRDWKASGLSKHAPQQAVLALANKLHISPAIPAGRVRHERHNFFLLKNLVGQGKVRGLFFEAQN